MIKNFIKQYYYYLIVGISTLVLAIGAFFMNHYIFLGVTSVLGLVLFLISEKLVKSKKDFIILLIAMWVGFAIRFNTILSPMFIYRLLISLCWIPMVLLFGLGFFLEKFFQKHQLPLLSELCFPIFYTLSIILLVLVKLGNEVNLFSFCFTLPIFCFDIVILKEFGFTFFVCLFFNLLAGTVTRKMGKGKYISLFFCTLCFLFLFLVGYSYKQSNVDNQYTNGSNIYVAVATQEELDFLGTMAVNYDREYRKNLFIKTVKEASEEGADLLILSEEFCTFYKENEEEAMEFFLSVIKQYKVPTVLTCDIVSETEKLENKLYMIDAEGNIIYEYTKHNLVPFIENGYYVSGDKNPEVVRTKIGDKEINISFLICFDLNDDFYVNKVPEETELLIVPSWDWDTGNIEQKRTWVRSIELNTTLIKHTYGGFTYVSNPFGLEVDYIDNRTSFETVQMINVTVWSKSDEDK